MVQIKNLLNKLGIDWQGYKIIYDNKYTTNETIIENEKITGNEFEVYCLTFGDKSKEYGMIIDKYGMLEDASLEKVIDELADYFC